MIGRERGTGDLRSVMTDETQKGCHLINTIGVRKNAQFQIATVFGHKHIARWHMNSHVVDGVECAGVRLSVVVNRDGLGSQNKLPNLDIIFGSEVGDAAVNPQSLAAGKRRCSALSIGSTDACGNP